MNAQVEGERIILREVELSDTDAVFAIYSDIEATQHLSFEPRTREQAEGIVARSIRSAQDLPRTEYALAVALRSSGEVIGFARLATEGQQAATIGFALNTAHWRQGLGVETVRALCSLGFDDLGLHRLWAARAPLNEASAKTLLRAGLIEEGRIRDHVYVHGAWRDSITYSMLAHEWTPLPVDHPMPRPDLF